VTEYKHKNEEVGMRGKFNGGDVDFIKYKKLKPR
jgi:hypothetical protein